MKIYDCITYFEEEFLFELRLKILNNYVDYFVVCESIYGHNGIKKKKLFNLNKFPEYKDKIIHLTIDKFPKDISRWERQDFQRNYLSKGIDGAKNDDYILFSDSDEIPNPSKFEELKLNKKFFLFEQKHFCYNFNTINSSEYYWEGTRACKKKYLKSFNWIRTKIKKKNLNYPFWRFDKEKNIKLIEDGGWHFSYFLTPAEIANKINSSPHDEFINEENLNVEIIKKRIELFKDPLGRNKKYERIKNLKILPNEVIQNQDLYKNWFV